MLNEKGKLICPEIRIENTNICNSRCIMCPRREMTRQRVTMGCAHFFYLVKQGKDLGATSVGIFGFGEPLLDKEIVKKVSFVTHAGMESHITTNGSLLNLDLARSLLIAGLKHIRFSIHAIEPNTYSNVHRGLNWFDTTKNMLNFVDINKQMGKPCTTHITCIPMHGESVAEVRETWEPLVDHLEVWRPHNWSGKKKYRTGEANRDCLRPFSGPVQIQADGNVIPCCFLTDGEVILGSTYENTILEILQGISYKHLHKQHIKKRLENLPCNSCDQRFETAESPLLYSNRDPDLEINRLSTSKTRL